MLELTFFSTFFICPMTCPDSSRVSFEAAERPNYFLHASPSGQVRLAKWEDSESFWTGATFIIRRNTWIPGFDSFESQAKAGFFLHAKPSRVHLLKYRATESFRRATLFRLASKYTTLMSPRGWTWRLHVCRGCTSAEAADVQPLQTFSLCRRAASLTNVSLHLSKFDCNNSPEIFCSNELCFLLRQNNMQLCSMTVEFRVFSKEVSL